MKIEKIKVGEIYKIAFAGNPNYLVQVSRIVEPDYIWRDGQIQLRYESFFAYPQNIRPATRAEKLLFKLEH